ncbi:hypothetical protein BLX24_25760 [Arsenicibacter rosenii]|uniref:DoxX-like family protein n=2 Tax=Arsenicibacter rosenii TaxID=1750698 RepID=A0A1S2VCW0_9BACT|nr:hypothetical protein BLX24_25760 [Arsenicibacter rosenii]
MTTGNIAAKQPKTLKIAYWTMLGLFAMAMLMDGGAGIVQEKNGLDVMHQLGYPAYAMIIFGTAKVLGALALLQPWFRTIKEWAYAGFTINLLGAMASWRFAVGDPAYLLPPLVMLVYLFVMYYLWKRIHR